MSITASLVPSPTMGTCFRDKFNNPIRVSVFFFFLNLLSSCLTIAFAFVFTADADPAHSTGGTDQVDLLTCGQCQRSFPLSDICRFVQHKVAGCSGGKDPPQQSNCNNTGGGGGADADAGAAAPLLDNGLPAQTKGKSHHHHHHHHHHRSRSPAGPDDDGHHRPPRRPPSSSTPKRRTSGDRNDGASSDDEKSTVRVKQGSESSEDLGYRKSNSRSGSSCVDAESNTVNSGTLSLRARVLLASGKL